MADTNRKRELIAVLAVLVVIAGIAATAIISANRNEAAETDTLTATSQPAADTPTSSTTNNQPAATTYKEGSYNVTGNYNTPGGRETIGINVTLSADGTVTATTAQNEATDRTAREYQDEFINAYANLVVGKKISDISLSRVSGSSLTSLGFNNALDSIEQQAAATTSS